jgi:glyoxylase-like metal-dependent hydrolase (beta-lactamase superfamily II)
MTDTDIPMIRAFRRAGLSVLERGWLSSNNVLFAADRDVPPVLVDSGYWSHGAQTVALVQHALAGRRLERIVNTHLHSDHCGGNAALQQAFDCAIDVPAGEAAKVDAWDEDALTFRATGQHCPRFRRAGAIAAGADVTLGGWQWQAIASPGHDPESIALYQPELELLIAADALWENGFGIVFPELDGEPGFDDVRATLERLSHLRVRGVIPGHGRPFADAAAAIGRAHRRLDGLVADPPRHARHATKVLIKFHLMELQRQTLDELGGWLDVVTTVREVHRRFGGTKDYRAWWRELLDELVASRALRVDGASIENA